MKRLLLLAIAVLFCATLFATPASAGLKFGVRQYLFQNMPLPTEQTMGAYFGVPVSPTFDIIFGLDYWNYKVSTEVTYESVTTEAEVSGGTLTLHGGARFYLNDQVKGNVAPYIQGEFFYGMGSASMDPEVEGFSLDPVEDLLSPYGFLAAFGAEFFAADNFSVGGEVGVRYVVTKMTGDTGINDLIDLGLAKRTAAMSDDTETKFTSMTIYSGITLNFVF
ncbi:MAG: hypothetical protein KKG33_06070 [candidate division Zixibacteria bacterium]|nr:hypothetical protein [candidate division Zixibacteria bacterium]MBU1469593.1 hypothetical protein [candidate division Zixibacteria bacterium]MBU2625108.1 hypothetical protein [candidate division Zixibacteria bacterium]